MSVGGRGSIGLDTSLENVLKHGARLASLHVDSELLVHLVGIHEFECLIEFISIEVSTSWHGDKAWCSMIGEVEEDSRVLGRLKDSLSGRSITLKDFEEVSSSSLAAFVLDIAACIDINTGSALWSWLVEELAWVWIF